MELRPGYKKTEIGVIPEDWHAEKLGEDIVLHSGHHVLAAHCNLTSGFPYLTGPADFPNGHINSTKFTTKPGTICETNDILVTVKGSGAGTLIVADNKYCISRQLMAIRPKEWDSQFLFYSLQQNASVISSAATGLIPGLSRTDILDQRIPVPCVSEQVAIAEALSDVDASIASLSRLIAKKRDLRQGAMQRLLTGHARLPGFGSDVRKYQGSDVGMIPEDWDVVSLGSLGETLIGLTYSPAQVASSGCLVLRSSNIQNDALSFMDNVYVTSAVPEKLMVRSGDVLICVRNGSRSLIGKSALLDERVRGMTFGAFMAVFRSEIGGLVSYLFQSSILKRQIDEHLGATINQITNKSLNSFKIPLPRDPLERTAISAALQDLDAELASVQSLLDKTRALRQAMMQALLTGGVRLPVRLNAASETKEVVHA